MIDIENQIVDRVIKAVTAEYPECQVSIGFDKVPERFPYVAISETDNYVNTKFRTTDQCENMAVITYEVNIFSNRQGAGKSECKRIAKIIDDLMLKLNFSRTTLTSVGNQMDSSIHRVFGRYRAEVDQNHRIYYRG